MLMALARWLVRNLSTLLLAFILASVVWISAVIVADPNEEHSLRPNTIEKVGQDPGLLLVGDVPDQVILTLRAPRSIWDKLNNDPSLARAWIDLSGLGPGEHIVEVKTQVNISPIRFVQVEPAQVHLILEPLVQHDFPVELVVNGELPMGYQKGEGLLEPANVTVSGPESAVGKVAHVRADLDISGAIETIRKTISVQTLDGDNNPVNNLTITPRSVVVTQPVSLLGGFKNVVVRVVTKGQVANGYRLTNISVSPPTITLFSDNPQLVNEIPGYVDTLPVDLTNLNDDIEINVGLNLMPGITLVREPNVLVQVSVAAIEGSLTLSLPIKVIGLLPDMQATVSPTTVDVIVAGPLYILDKLTPSSFRVVLDLSGLPPGIYQRSPIVDLLPDLVRVQTTLPETVEVTVAMLPTPTPSATGSPMPPGSSTPGPAVTPTLTPTPTPKKTP